MLRIFCLLTSESEKSLSNDRGVFTNQLKEKFESISISTDDEESNIEPHHEIAIDITKSCVKALKSIYSPEFNIFIFFTSAECFSKKITDNWKPPKPTNRVGLNIVINEESKGFSFAIKNKIITTHVNSKIFSVDILDKLIRTFFHIEPLYISYAGNDETTGLVKEIMSTLNIALPFLEVHEYETTNGYKKDVPGFIKKIGDASSVIFILNKKFLLSEYCMDEFSLFVEKESSKEYFPIVLNDAKVIYDDSRFDKEITGHWREERDKKTEAIIEESEIIAQLEEKRDDPTKIKLRDNAIQDIEIKSTIKERLVNEERKCRRIVKSTIEIQNYFRNPNTLSPDKLRRTNFSAIILDYCLYMNRMGLYKPYESIEDIENALKPPKSTTG